MQKESKRIFVWNAAVRLSHLAMIVGFFGGVFSSGVVSFGFLGSFFDGFFQSEAHALFGSLFFVALIFRLFWGFLGSKYSRFCDFSFSGVFVYLRYVFLVMANKSRANSAKPRYIGHNPASSFAILFILIFGLILGLSGFILLGFEESGVFYFLAQKYSSFSFAKFIHNFAFYGVLCVVCVHIFGAILDKFLHKNDALDSMISGFKHINLEQDSMQIRTNIAQKVFCGFWVLCLFLCVLAFLPSLKERNFFIKSYSQEIDYFTKAPSFAKECGSCHTLYAPFFLPSFAWENLMDNLENHFGDDASVDLKTQKEITDFLKENAAEKFDTKISKNILKNYQNNQIAITQNAYWQELHKDIKDEVFKSEKIKSKANCKACHFGIEKALIQKRLITITR